MRPDASLGSSEPAQVSEPCVERARGGTGELSAWEHFCEGKIPAFQLPARRREERVMDGSIAGPVKFDCETPSKTQG